MPEVDQKNWGLRVVILPTTTPVPVAPKMSWQAYMVEMIMEYDEYTIWQKLMEESPTVPIPSGGPALTLICVRQGTFQPLLFLDQIFWQLNFYQKFPNFFGGEN